MVSKQSPESVFNTEDSSEYATLEPKLRPLGRRSFLKRIGFGGMALLPAASWLASNASAKDDSDRGGGLSHGDAALLRFLAAAEILETDLWQQYNELALGNAAFQQALGVLDEDMPTYV